MIKVPKVTTELYADIRSWKTVAMGCPFGKACLNNPLLHVW